jgi:hypothetical protein
MIYSIKSTLNNKVKLKWTILPSFFLNKFSVFAPGNNDSTGKRKNIAIKRATVI